MPASAVVITLRLQAVAPDLFARGGIDYSHTRLVNISLWYVYLLRLLCLVMALVYYRLCFTELGATFREAVRDGEPLE